MDFTLLHNYIQSLPSVCIPAADCVVYHKHRPVFRSMAGYSDGAQTIPVSNRDYYWLYSSTKVATCTAVLQLMEQGKLALTDEVGAYLPAYKSMLVREADGTLIPAARSIRIVDLLTMSSGLSYDLQAKPIRELLKAQGGSATTRQVMDALALEPLCFHPGERYQYSLSHDVLGAVVEAISGMRLGEYMQKNIFAPLGMRDTTFAFTPDVEKRLTAFYTYDASTMREKLRDHHNEYVFSPEYESGGAGLLSTVDDYALFVDAMANLGQGANGSRILRPETVELMRTNHLGGALLADYWADNYANAGYGYGLGVRTLMNGKRAKTPSPAGEFGWGGAAGTNLLADPDNQIAIFYAQQVIGLMPFAYETHPHNIIRRLVYRCMEIA